MNYGHESGFNGHPLGKEYWIEQRRAIEDVGTEGLMVPSTPFYELVKEASFQFASGPNVSTHGLCFYKMLRETVNRAIAASQLGYGVDALTYKTVFDDAFGESRADVIPLQSRTESPLSRLPILEAVVSRSA